MQAFRTFRYQRVFNPVDRCLVTLTPLPSDLSDEPLDYIGASLDAEMVRHCYVSMLSCLSVCAFICVHVVV